MRSRRPPVRSGYRPRSVQAAPGQQRLDVRLPAAEFFIKRHGVVGPAPGKDVVPERGGGFFIENAGLLEGLEGVGVQHFGPDVTVVARRVHAGEDVPEIGRAVARDDLRDQAAAAHRGLLELQHVRRFRLGQGVPVHVEVAGGQVFHGFESLVEVSGSSSLSTSYLSYWIQSFFFGLPGQAVQRQPFSYHRFQEPQRKFLE